MKSISEQTQRTPKGLSSQWSFDSSPANRHGLPNSNKEFHSTRPTFYGNSGILCHRLYEIQIVDNNRMSYWVDGPAHKPIAGCQQILPPDQYRSSSLQQGPTVYIDEDGLTQDILEDDREHWDPAEGMIASSLTRGAAGAKGGDNIMAIITGPPCLYFRRLSPGSLRRLHIDRPRGRADPGGRSDQGDGT